jgi:tRNA-specific 2-thiouridylase
MAQAEQEHKRVVVAMSGGVDSSVAAMLLVDAGYDVTGMMARLWAKSSPAGVTNRCCTPQGVDDARRVAGLLSIPFYLVDHEQQFRSAVVDYFVSEYAAGRTPNPCLACNRQIRFGLLLQRALDLGAEYLATGHYARVAYQGGSYHLLKGIDGSKDQSYVLHVLGQKQLAHLLFPLGDLTKAQVRDLARRRGLPVAEKAESQDICFLPDDDYRSFVAAEIPGGQAPGAIVDQNGAEVGQHRGLLNYTVGQRHGLGLATGTPLYVTALDVERNTLVVGPAEALRRRQVTIRNLTYVGERAPSAPFDCRVRVRYRANEVDALVVPAVGDTATVHFREPHGPLSAGQAAVFYHGDEVIGGGTIVAAGDSPAQA